VLGEAQALLERFVEQSSSGDLGVDEPEPFAGQPNVGGRVRNSQEGRIEPNRPNSGRDARMSMDEKLRRVAIGAQIQAGKRLAEGYLFAQRFPGAARIRSV
jgi:hypothetical protein